MQVGGRLFGEGVYVSWCLPTIVAMLAFTYWSIRHFANVFSDWEPRLTSAHGPCGSVGYSAPDSFQVLAHFPLPIKDEPPASTPWSCVRLMWVCTQSTWQAGHQLPAIAVAALICLSSAKDLLQHARRNAITYYMSCHCCVIKTSFWWLLKLYLTRLQNMTKNNALEILSASVL